VTFDNEWIFERFDAHPTFFTRRMFGGLAAYLFERQMLVLVEPTKTGRWKWHGVLICTDHGHQTSIRADFPALRPMRCCGNGSMSIRFTRGSRAPWTRSPGGWRGTTRDSVSSRVRERKLDAAQRRDR